MPVCESRRKHSSREMWLNTQYSLLNTQYPRMGSAMSPRTNLQFPFLTLQLSVKLLAQFRDDALDGNAFFYGLWEHKRLYSLMKEKTAAMLKYAHTLRCPRRNE